MTALLEFAEVDAFYGEAHILHSLSFAVQEKERIALLGRNGVGKTTVVNALLGLAKVRRGQVRIKGEVVKKYTRYAAARAGIAIVPQGRRIIPDLSVRENLLLGGVTQRAGPWRLSRVFDLFPFLRERCEQTGTSLSGGQQQMLAIGRSLMANPELLILDEPTEGLAPVIVDELAVVLKSIAEQGTSVLLIEQNLKLVNRTTEKYYVLSKGSVVVSGQVSELNRGDLAEHMMA